MIGWIVAAVLLALLVLSLWWADRELGANMSLREQINRGRGQICLALGIPSTADEADREFPALAEEIRQLLRDRGQAREDARIAGEVKEELRAAKEAAERETMRWIDENARLTTVLDQIGTLAHGSIGMESADCPPDETPGNPRAIAGQSGWVDDGSSLTHRTDLGGWVPVGDRLPTEDDYADLLVAVRSDAGGEPWTDRAFMHADGRWRWARDHKQLLPGIRITHWMPVPLPPDSPNA